MSCDVDSGTRDFRLDSSCLFYLSKFSFVVHTYTNCSFFAFCTHYYLRYDSEHIELVISGTGRPQENKIFKFLKIYFNKIAFIQIDFFAQKLFACNIGEARWPHGKCARLRSERSVLESWPGTLCCVLRLDTLLSGCLSPPRCVNGYRRR